MTLRRTAQSIGLGGVFALGVLAMLGSNGTPETPKAAEVQIPSPGRPGRGDRQLHGAPLHDVRTHGQGKIRCSRRVAHGDRPGR